MTQRYRMKFVRPGVHELYDSRQGCLAFFHDLTPDGASKVEALMNGAYIAGQEAARVAMRVALGIEDEPK